MPALAVKPLWKTTAASVCLNAASRRSSSMWICHRAGDRAHRARADAERRERVERALHEVAGASSARDSCSTRD